VSASPGGMKGFSSRAPGFKKKKRGGEKRKIKQYLSL
jgi:hypothetical protein